MLSDTARTEIQALMGRYPRARSAIVPALYVAQREIGWLPTEVMDEIASIFDMEPMEVYAIAGFYNMLYKEPKGRFHLEICTNVPCMLRGANEIADYLKQRLGINFGETTPDGNFTLDHMECLGSCATAPMMFARRTRSAWGRYYENLTPERVDAILQELLENEDLPMAPDPAGPYHHDHHPETNFLLARIDKPDSHTIESYLADGGYQAAARTLQMDPADVIETVKRAGVRGRGGAGFPAGVKWGFIPKDVFPRYLVVNCDESEPGTFKDRLIVENDPHQLLEGIIDTCWAIQAHYAFIYVRGEYM
ncbi:MAG: NADH-quinone oxidoreductase subunit E, partial [Caldilineae bacterium]